MARSSDTYRKARRNIQRDTGEGFNPWRQQYFWVQANERAHLQDRIDDAHQAVHLIAQVQALFALKHIQVDLRKGMAQALCAFYLSNALKQPRKRTWSRIMRQLTAQSR